MVNKFLWGFVCGFFAILTPAASLAFTYNYYKPLDGNANTLLLSWGPFGALENFSCDLNTYTCGKTSQKSFAKTPNLTLENDQAWYNTAKNLAIYKATEKSAAEKITRYYLSFFDQNQWSSGRQLSIVDDIQKIYWPDNARNEFIYVTVADAKSNKDIVRFDLNENREKLRAITADEITNVTVSPDGRWLAYYAPLNNGSKSTVLLDLLSQNPKEYRFKYAMPKNWELLTDENRLLAFSPDSRRLAFLEDSRGFSTARLANLADIEIQPLSAAETVGTNTINTALDIWFSDNSTLLVAGNDKKNPLDWYLYSYGVQSKSLVPVISDIAYMYEMRPDGGKIIIGKMSGANLVPAIYDPATKKYHEFNLQKSSGAINLTREVMTFKNGLNGVLTKTNNTKIDQNTPLVVWLHGGPFRQIGKEYHSYPSYAVYDWTLDQLALNGAIVLKIDYSGSYGYGNPAAYDLVNNAGKNDTRDVYNALVETKKKLNWNGKSYLMGNSYGGYLAPRTLAEYPNDFAGAIGINGVYEWRTMLNYLKTSIFNVHFNGLFDPNKPELYEQASITKNIDKLTSNNKVLIINGMSDKTINPDQSYTFYELLKTTGKNVEIVSIPEEDHIFYKTSSIETICKTAGETMELKINAGACQFK